MREERAQVMWRWPFAAEPRSPGPHRQRRQLSLVPAGGPGPWLFPGLHPERPALPATISHRLAASASPRRITRGAAAEPWFMAHAGELATAPGPVPSPPT